MSKTTTITVLHDRPPVARSKHIKLTTPRYNHAFNNNKQSQRKVIYYFIFILLIFLVTI